MQEMHDVTDHHLCSFIRACLKSYYAGQKSHIFCDSLLTYAQYAALQFSKIHDLWLSLADFKQALREEVV